MTIITITTMGSTLNVSMSARMNEKITESTITDLKERAKALDTAGPMAYNVYEKLLGWRRLKDL
jgi:hypothetical protein